MQWPLVWVVAWGCLRWACQVWVVAWELTWAWPVPSCTEDAWAEAITWPVTLNWSSYFIGIGAQSKFDERNIWLEMAAGL